ncbi:type VI secretion system lipoprotein TssJ [Massilia sp. 9I]|uniref:type VI secretion system lipoprotein TssJ n=1 Tax=Massilia sp. 9I TaxID=2653152 RepID=UPI0012F040F3|nr:type VI secretion system lipoprotein TssJ [Massilia sp. 9I]VXA92088.1 Type VI secretion system protein VasD [Massilia sp. 9I]
MRTISCLAALTMTCLVASCGSNGIASKALELPDAQKPPRTVALRLHASPKLNLDKRGQPIALAVRLYKLRRPDAFGQAPYSTFLNPQAERESLGADLVEVREIMLVPGQRYEVQEKVSREASHLAVVALFQRPAEQRWRATVAAADAERAGLTVGLHACALTMGSSSQTSTLSSVRCQ